MNPAVNAARIAAFSAVTGCAPTTLEELAIALADAARIGADDAIDWSSLPTFGGNEPSDTSGVWSWDAESLLVGEGSDLEIIPR